MALQHKRYFICLLAAATLLLPVAMHAQVGRMLKKGNELYDEQKYSDATASYMKALQKDPNNVAGMFNLGNALYQQKQYDSSRKVMASLANAIKDKQGAASANYNIGNTYMAQKKWQEAVDAYKQSLRNNPEDTDAKYNLSYAEQMLKQQQNKQKQDSKDQKNKDQQQKDQKPQDKDTKDDKNNPPQDDKNKMSKQEADRMLNALQQQEKKLQDKMKKGKGIPAKMDKDW